MQDVIDNGFLWSSDYHTKLFMFVIVLWGLWTVRNKMGIVKIFPRNSNENFHKIFVCFQKWHILLREQGARYLDDKITRMKSWLQVFGRKLKIQRWRGCYIGFSIFCSLV
jgi:hypothetical protein